MIKFAPEILHEEADLLVINKPAGLQVHGDGKSEQPTLVDWLLENYPEIKDVGEPMIFGEKRMGIESRFDLSNRGSSILQAKSGEIYLGDPVPEVKTVIVRPGIVHRLDRDTSGVMVIAKNQKTFEFLKLQFASREVLKKYFALVWGNFIENEGEINRPIGKGRKDFRQWSTLSNSRGLQRDAVTEWRVIERFKLGEESLTFLEVTPKTGRTHQIRVHLKSIHHPVVCDTLYAPNRACLGSMRSTDLPDGRQALHAGELTISLPNGERKTFEAPLPEDFKKTLEQLRKA